jgi:UDP-2,3-diacylglucosamine hydrolase
VSKPDFIASDVHLGAAPPENERAFAAFLEHVAGEARSLLIPGDLFDFWFEWGDITIGPYFRTLAALRRIVDAGVPVTMLGGNHDAWGGRFLREHVGVEFHAGPIRCSLGGRPALVAHGDGVGRGDLKYRALKALLRSRVAVTGFRLLHPELGLALARRVSRTEVDPDDRATAGRARYIREWALKQLAADTSLGYVVCGHCHVPEMVEHEPGRWYLNAGDWVTHRTYIEVPDDAPPRLVEWAPP